MTRGHRGSLVLRCRALSSPSPCRFIPAHQNFIACDRGQEMLLPPSLTDWLPEDHLVWTVLGAVEQMDLDGF